MNFLSGFAPNLLFGAGITLLVSATSLFVGLQFGFIGAGLQLSRFKILQWLGQAYSNLVRGVPELLLIFLFFYGGTHVLSLLSGEYYEVSPFFAGVIALSLIFGAYSAESIRVAYLSVPEGLIEAGQSVGMTGWQIFVRIRLPLLFRNALPALGNLWLVLLKESALISVVGLNDLMRNTQIAIGFTKEPFKFYLVASLLYLLMTTFSQKAIARWEKTVMA